jgi:hypothetical protein
MRTCQWLSGHIARTAILIFGLVGAAEAGPPLVCHPFETGPAALLPWSDTSGWNAPDRAYAVQRLVPDTMRLLSPNAPVLARMENLRRATVYAAQDRRVAAELLSAVLGRALSTVAAGNRDPMAWFDAGYLVETYRQASAAFKWDMLAGTAPQTLDGYSFIKKAIELGGPAPEMEYAASLVKEGSAAAEHRRRALAGAPAGSMLARNLAR